MQSHTHRHRIFYKSLPKVELHRHLEGSLRLSTLMEAARENHLDIPYDSTGQLRPLVQMQANEDFTHRNFLAKFGVLRQFYQSPEMIRRVTEEMIADAAADNVCHMEFRFTPVALTRVKDFPLGEAMDWVAESAREASDKYSVSTLLIASVNRHESAALAEEVIQLAVERMDKGVVGIDLAGDEMDHPASAFAGLFREAKQAGLRTTVHAGEWRGPENVLEAIEELGADRVAHGVRVMEDEAVTAMAREREVPFEVCVTSNYQSGVVPKLEEHPLPKMLRAGLAVTINTDDPSISQIDLSDEYELACENLGLSMAELRQCMVNAARHSFLEEEKREELVRRMEEG